MKRVWAAAVAVVGVVGVAAFLTIQPRGEPDEARAARPARVVVDVGGTRLVMTGNHPTAVRALTSVGTMPVDGALRSVVSGTVLDPLHNAGYVMVNGKPSSMDTRLRRGARVEVVNGTDVVEETALRKVAIPYPNQDKVGTPGWLPGAEGLAEETYGVVSGEVVERRTVRESVAAREIVRPAEVSAGSAVYLTFDDGPDPTWTPQVLDVLRANGVKATFCVLGRSVAAHPDLARRIVAEGHALCNHTQTHARLTALTVAEVEAEITSAQETIASVAGVRPSTFRVPYGASSPEVDDVIARLGYRKLGWTVDTSDWTLPGADAIFNLVAAGVRPGGIVLLHDGGGDRSQTLAALGRLIPALREAGYTFGRP